MEVSMRRAILWVPLLLLFGVRLAAATPIDYAFSGVLGDCPDHIHDTCFNGWSGQTVTGHFRFDSDTNAFLEWGFGKADGPVYSWLGPFFPAPAQWESSAGGNASAMHFQLYIPSALEQFDVDLVFTKPLTATTGSTLASGLIDRRAQSVLFPFASGAVEVVPEPASLLLLGAGGLGLLVKMRRSKKQNATNA
jgi:PEP-CTERM motif-containing protein